MKKLSIALILALALGGAAFAIEETSTPIQEAIQAAPTGSARIEKLRADYEQGQFNSLLDDLEKEYATLQQSGRVEEFAEMRKVVEANEKIQGIMNQYEKLAAKLFEERNAELITQCEGHGGEIGTDRVKSVTAPIDEKQKEAMRALSSLRFKTPGQAASPDERTLIEIDLAYEFKSVSLDQSDDLQEKRIILGMDKMKKMLEASQSFTDESLKETVSLAAAGFDASLAKNLDWRDLLASAKKPSSDLDRSIAGVLSEYKVKKAALYQKECIARLEALKG